VSELEDYGVQQPTESMVGKICHSFCTYYRFPDLGLIDDFYIQAYHKILTYRLGMVQTNSTFLQTIMVPSMNSVVSTALCLSLITHNAGNANLLRGRFLSWHYLVRCRSVVGLYEGSYD
jgi:hypothetical protein